MGLLNPLETRISLEMSGDTKLYMLSAKQGDKATRYVVADLSNNGQRYIIPHGAYAVVNVKKPDGKKVYNDCVYSESEVMFELTNQMLAAAGTAYCDIEIRTKDEAEIIKTQTFTIEIEKMMRNDSAILSSDEYTFFEKSMLKVKEITESLNNAKIDFSEAEKRENISTEDTFAVILGKLEKIISEIKEVAFSGEYSDLTGAPEDVGDLTNNAGYVTTDTWKANTADDEGYVEASNGKANQVWGTDAEGNPGWRNAVEEMAGATEETEGAAGIVPAPDAGQQDAFFRGDGIWTNIDEMTGATVEAAGAAGIVPAPAAGMQDAFLRGDATWGNLGAAALAGIANNLATTQEGFLLDARQGKELADQISLVNSAMKNYALWSKSVPQASMSITELPEGIYNLSSYELSKLTSLPPGFTSGGSIIITSGTASSSEKAILIINSRSGSMFYGTLYGGPISWKKVDFTAL